jgi:hypothetical protein
VYCNTPRDLTVPARRFGMNYFPNPNAAPLIPNLPGVLLNNATIPASSPSIPAGTAGNYPTFYDDGAATLGPGLVGADLLLSNVISFDVRLLASGAADFQDVFQLANANGGSNNSFFSATNGPMVFDTWSSVRDDVGIPGVPLDYTNWDRPGMPSSIPIWNNTNPPIIKAVQIILRVWDEKTEQTRQATLVVPL